MSKSQSASGVAVGAILVGKLLLSTLAAGTFGSPPVTVGDPAANSRVPAWDAAGLGQLPWQGISCAYLTADGNRVAVGTMAPRGDPNVFLIDSEGKIIEQHAVGMRWIGEVCASDGGEVVAAVCTSPRGAAGDEPAVF